MKQLLEGFFHDFDVSKTKDSIIAASNNSITIYECNTNIKHDIQINNPNKVCYYPVGNRLVTISNNEGIGIWDIYSLNQIYHYKDEVYDHTFTNKNTIIANTYSGIKMFDLRCRTNVGYLPMRNVKGFDVYNDSFCIYTETQIMKGNIKRMVIDSKTNVNDVRSIKFLDEANYFYVYERGKKYYLCTNEHEYDKEVDNYKLAKVGKYVGLYGDKEITYFSIDNIYKQEIDMKIDKMIYKEDNDMLYVTTDKTIITLGPKYEN